MGQTESKGEELHSSTLKEILSSHGSKGKMLKFYESGKWRLLKNLKAITKATHTHLPLQPGQHMSPPLAKYNLYMFLLIPIFILFIPLLTQREHTIANYLLKFAIVR